MDILTLIKSGLQSMLSRQSANKSAEEPMSEESETEEITEIRVHKIIAGPFSASDDPEFDPDVDMDYFWVDCMAEVDGEMIDLTIGHDDFDKIYTMVKHLNSATLEPYVIGVNND